ncbi:LytR family transcriptional regulator [Streptomyces finlayi]|uniref:LytR family transcriptional regulator n=1 Tax=Streptomyces finlayi TaxID=67296 RepID=A0A7G7BNQ9_9ACTN|nr:LCP family protein [Streptomyces finlayi]QNE76974.1 LytR family transcriptional regulator [Streptomyces finlayi]
MDADVTDSAGTPADPDQPGPEDEPQAGKQDGSGADAPQDGPRAPGSGTPADPEAGSGSGTDAGSGAAPEAGSGSGPDAGGEAVTEAGEETEPEAGTKAATEARDKTEPEAGTKAATEAGEEAGPAADAKGGPEARSTPAEAGDGEQAWSERPKDALPPGYRRHWLRWTALGASFVVLVAAGAGWWLYKKLDGNIKTDTGAAAELKAYEKERPTPIAVDAQNILLIGSDSRSGDNSKYGRDDGGSQRSDTTILLHLAADRRSATAVSIPRDLMADIPACHTADKKTTTERFAQFNWAFEVGGTACTIRTVERMTGIRVDHHMVVDFNGFKDMVDAVDGVEVCLKEPVKDADAHLELPAGRQKLDGEAALGYVRARKSIGNGSDTERMDRQQKFLGALVNKMQSNGVLLNPTRLYPVLDAATKSLTTDPGLASLRDLYDLVRGMRNVPTDKVQFLTVPRQPYRANINRDELVEPDAGRLFKQLREDAPVAVVPADEIKSSESPGADPTESEPSNGKPDDSDSADPSPAPTFSGSNAADDLCKQ